MGAPVNEWRPPHRNVGANRAVARQPKSPPHARDQNLPADSTVLVTWHSPMPGVARPWWSCPVRSACCRFVYLRGGAVGCWRCLGLRFPSRHVHRQMPGIHRIARVEILRQAPNGLIGGTPVPVTWIEGPSGGSLPWIECPRCARRCLHMYLRDGPACRRCHHLGWLCRHVCRQTRGILRIARWRRHIKADPHPFSARAYRGSGRQFMRDVAIRMLIASTAAPLDNAIPRKFPDSPQALVFAGLDSRLDSRLSALITTTTTMRCRDQSRADARHLRPTTPSGTTPLRRPTW